MSEYVAECLKIVDASGLDYRINPMGTVVEGDYDEVMALVKKCHMRVMELSNRVVTTVKIDDRKGANHMMTTKVGSVEVRLGKKLKF